MKNILLILSLTCGQLLYSAHFLEQSFEIDEGMQLELVEILYEGEANIAFIFDMFGWDSTILSDRSPKECLGILSDRLLGARNLSEQLRNALTNATSKNDYVDTSALENDLNALWSKVEMGNAVDPFSISQGDVIEQRPSSFVVEKHDVLTQSRRLLTELIDSGEVVEEELRDVIHRLAEQRKNFERLKDFSEQERLQDMKEFHETFLNTLNAAVLALIKCKELTAKEAFYDFSVILDGGKKSYLNFICLHDYFARHLFVGDFNILDEFSWLFSAWETLPTFKTPDDLKRYRSQAYFFEISKRTHQRISATSVPSNHFHRRAQKAEANKKNASVQKSELVKVTEELLENGNYSVDKLIPLIDRIYAHQGPVELALQNLINAVALDLISRWQHPASFSFLLFKGVVGQDPGSIRTLKELCTQKVFKDRSDDLEKFFELFKRFPKDYQVQKTEPWSEWQYFMLM